jgi:hypothetical protein
MISSFIGHWTGTSGWLWHLDGSVTVGSIPRENIKSNFVGSSLGRSFNFANADIWPLHKQNKQVSPFSYQPPPLTKSPVESKIRNSTVTHNKGFLCKEGTRFLRNFLPYLDNWFQAKIWQDSEFSL